jgi:hypothetical protein
MPLIPIVALVGGAYAYGRLSDDGLTWTKAAIIAASAAFIYSKVKS